MYRVEENYETTEKYGTLGLDLNDGFIVVTETDESGNIVKQKQFNYKNIAELKEDVAKITKLAVETGKDIGSEDLDFKNTKAKAIKSNKKKDKAYNRMLHRLPYREYMEALKCSCARNKVNLAFINPRNSSKHAEKYFYRKLNRHQGASYIIARRAMNLKD